MNRPNLTRLVRSVLRQVSEPLRTTVPQHDTVLAPDGEVVYAPELDGRPDPGEVVWAWVPYEDDPTQGKDRPVLVIGRRGATLQCLQLSSQDHDRDAADEARYGRYWMDIGAGGWDRERRPSEARLDRLLQLTENQVRREGAALDRAMFEAVVRQARIYHDL